MVKKEEEASSLPHPACAEEEQRGFVTHGGQYGGKNTDEWMDGWMGSRNMSHYGAAKVLIQYLRVDVRQRSSFHSRVKLKGLEALEGPA